MRKLILLSAIAISLAATTQIASAQLLTQDSMEIRDSKMVMDRVISKLPNQIECVSVKTLKAHDRRDTRTTQASLQKHVFNLTNLNVKLTGGYQLSDTEPSVAVYSLSGGSSTMNALVTIAQREAKILAISPPLEQPNTCQTGMIVARY